LDSNQQFRKKKQKNAQINLQEQEDEQQIAGGQNHIPK
jgi:hypothetical protein